MQLNSKVKRNDNTYALLTLKFFNLVEGTSYRQMVQMSESKYTRRLVYSTQSKRHFPAGGANKFLVK